jgi:hypothetical protein
LKTLFVFIILSLNMTLPVKSSIYFYNPHL